VSSFKLTPSELVSASASASCLNDHNLRNILPSLEGC
jgi:hypothetical protein